MTSLLDAPHGAAPRPVLTGSQLPRLYAAPPFVSSSGQEAAELAAMAGLELDPWQRYVLDQGLGERVDGSWSAFEVAVNVPRQNGKNGILEMVELFFMAQLGLKILHTAHEVKTARTAFLRIASFFENERNSIATSFAPSISKIDFGIELSRTKA